MRPSLTVAYAHRAEPVSVAVTEGRMDVVERIRGMCAAAMLESFVWWVRLDGYMPGAMKGLHDEYDWLWCVADKLEYDIRAADGAGRG